MNPFLAYPPENRPGSVLVDKKEVAEALENTLAGTLETDFSSVAWSWNEQTKECRVKIPDKRKKIQITIR